MRIIISFSPTSFLGKPSRCTSSSYQCLILSSCLFLSRPSLCLAPFAPANNRCCISVCCRITLNGMKVSRPDVRIGRYRMIKHERDKHNEPNPQRYCISVRPRSRVFNLWIDRACFCLAAALLWRFSPNFLFLFLFRLRELWLCGAAKGTPSITCPHN